MLLPVGHERNTVSRLPIVTIILIVTNILAFVLTTGTIQSESGDSGIAILRMHILILKARYSDLTLTPEIQQMVDDLRTRRPDTWKWIAAPDRKPVDAWEATLVADPDPNMDRLQAEMDTLCQQLEKLETDDNSLLWRYAYHSYKPTVQSYITHQFLHGGWLHLISNMWILWLCGVVLEDVWVHFLVLGFYLIGGIFAAFFHGWMNPQSMIPMIGASGAIAGLMGALLARFPRLKIKMAYFLFVVRFRTFDAPVYVVAPLWFVAELFWGMMGSGSVAHWAHVGGFVFGVAIGLGLYAVKIENVVNRPSPEDVWAPDEQFLRASDLLDQRETDRCIAEVSAYLRREPSSREGWELLLKAQERKGEQNAQRDETLPALIRICLATGDGVKAAEYIGQFRAMGGILPTSVWMDLARDYEKAQQWNEAAREYEQLGQTYYTGDRISLTALMSAARINLSKLNRAAEAERLYRAAQSSPLPHLDLDGLIEQGLKESTYGTPAKGAVSGYSSGV
jgi:membrane associated rhomboid family serine protease